MENLEDELEEAGAPLRFWIRYVDDLLAIFKREEAGTILEKLNRAHRNIDFTMEIEKKGEIPFLDLKIIRERGDFEFDIYRKRTQTQRTITYTSNHDFHHKTAAYNFMIHRMITTLLNEERRNKEMNYTLETAKKNRYSRNLIENRTKKKLRQASRQQLSRLFQEVNTEPRQCIALSRSGRTLNIKKRLHKRGFRVTSTNIRYLLGT